MTRCLTAGCSKCLLARSKLHAVYARVRSANFAAADGNAAKSTPISQPQEQTTPVCIRNIVTSRPFLVEYQRRLQRLPPTEETYSTWEAERGRMFASWLEAMRIPQPTTVYELVVLWAAAYYEDGSVL